MAVDAYWRALRAGGEGTSNAFEELCCQLAALEPAPAGSRFMRLAPPDGGVECFWTLPNGDEHGWQAKFFSSLGRVQWRQLDDSARRALDKHPRMTRYVVCLPFDRSDAGARGQRSMLAKWADWKQKWVGEALRSGRQLVIDYWGTHELRSRLQRPENTGLRAYWFDELPFDDPWFRKHVDTTIAAAGGRYMRDLHVAVDVEGDLAALARAPELQRQWDELTGAVRKARLRIWEEAWQLTPESRGRVEAFVSIAISEELQGTGPFPSEEVRRVGALALVAARKLRDAIQNKLLREKKGSPRPEPDQLSPLQKLAWWADHAANLVWAISDAVAFVRSPHMNIAERALYVLTGDAGTGKTHVLARTADLRADAGLPTLFVLGGQLRGSVPWTDIAAVAGLPLQAAEPRVLLGALNAAAIAKRTRALILIDALNETRDQVWKTWLPAMIQTLATYPAVGLGVSVRTTYADEVLPEQWRYGDFEREHEGFDEHEDEAVRRYFDHYGLRLPGAPLLPEFRNPLYLKLTCQALVATGVKDLPLGSQGFSAVFVAILGAADKVATKRLGLHHAQHVCRSLAQELARRMLRERTSKLNLDDALALSNAVHTTQSFASSVLKVLIDESLVVETAVYQPTDGLFGDIEMQRKPVVEFTYQRFADWLRAGVLIEALQRGRGSVDLGNAISQILRGYAPDGQGLLEALAVLLPEKLEIELCDVAGESWISLVGRSMLQGVQWRDPRNLSERSHEAFLQLLDEKSTRFQAFDVALVLASRENHPLNARWLHDYLLGLPMVDRDEVWSTTVSWTYHRAEEEQRRSELHRLVDWARSPRAAETASDEVALLVALTLGWTLTSSHRKLRDRATNALVLLLEGRPKVLVEFLELFRGVDDPYVAERMMAVSCGCALRTADSAVVQTVACKVHELFFRDGALPAHVLLRDYVRTIMERALHLGVLPPCLQPEHFRPPYESQWPTELPELCALEKQLDFIDEDGKEHTSRVAGSLVHRGDFGIYVVHDGQWLNWRLRGGPPPSAEQLMLAVKDSLRGHVRRLFDSYESAAEARSPVAQAFEVERSLHGSGNLARDFFGVGSSDRTAEHPALSEARRRFEEAKAAEATSCDALRAALSADQREQFERALRLKRPGRRSSQDLVPPEDIIRFMLHRMFARDWRPHMFYSFDRSLPYTGRDAPTFERISKKYQWIAWHEAAATLSDNFAWAPDYDEFEGSYEGPWQLHARDLDPTMPLQPGPARLDGPWWSPFTTDEVLEDWDSEDWWSADAVPVPYRLIDVEGPDPVWLALDVLRTWSQQLAPGAAEEGVPNHDVWVHVRAWLCKKSDAVKLVRWIETNDLFGPHLPDPHQFESQTMLREIGWAPAWEAEACHDTVWRPPQDSGFPIQVHVPAATYVAGAGSKDKSLDASLNVMLPSTFLVETLRLRTGCIDGQFFDEDGRLAFLDPAVSEGGPNALLMRKDLLERLREQGYDLVWTVMCNKRRYGLRDGRSDRGIVREVNVSGSFRFGSGKLVGRLVKEPKEPAQATKRAPGPRAPSKQLAPPSTVVAPLTRQPQPAAARPRPRGPTPSGSGRR